MHPAIGRIKATRRRLASLPREDGNILRIIRGRMSLRVRSEHGHVYGDRLSKKPSRGEYRCRRSTLASGARKRTPAALRAAALSLLGYLQSSNPFRPTSLPHSRLSQPMRRAPPPNPKIFTFMRSSDPIRGHQCGGPPLRFSAYVLQSPRRSSTTDDALPSFWTLTFKRREGLP